jgi:hypothetical protein
MERGGFFRVVFHPGPFRDGCRQLARFATGPPLWVGSVQKSESSKVRKCDRKQGVKNTAAPATMVIFVGYADVTE